jgi:hypothetical protein
MAQLSHSRLLFAEKHYGPARALGIRAALALGHAIRIAVFGVAAAVSAAQRERVRDEWAGLRVIAGRSAPPLGPPADAPVAPRSHPGAASPAGDRTLTG